MDRFRTERQRDYIELFDNDKRICSCDNDREVEEEMNNILNSKIY